MDSGITNTLEPVLVLLALAVGAAIGSKALRTSAIVGYILLGLALNALGLHLVAGKASIALLANLGVMFLLFELGVHFPLRQIWERARDILGFGSAQVLLGMVGIGLVMLLTGASLQVALLLGAVLALSSTAVVARLLADRHQQSCPVGQTATAILIFQDVAGILLLVVVTALGGGAAVFPAIAVALGKATLAFCAAMLMSRLVVRPLFDLAARSGAEEVFTAVALVFALGAGWLSAKVGLSLTLGAFLGGVALADTPYRATVATEVKPFRGLLLSFFFISVGASVDLKLLAADWPLILAAGVGLIAIKSLTNIAVSLRFNWSIPGSVQLGLLIAQGSEFAFVLLSLPALRAVIGAERSAIAIAAVALSLMATPSLAAAGRELAGSIRRRRARVGDPELTPLASAPVLIIGMGRRGRMVADALEAFDIDYAAVERDPHRLKKAVADGYPAYYGDMADARLWSSMDAASRKVSVLTGPVFDEVESVDLFARQTHPTLRRVAAVFDPDQERRFGELDVVTVLDTAAPAGVELASFVLKELGIPVEKIAEWRARSSQDPVSTPAAELAFS